MKFFPPFFFLAAIFSAPVFGFYPTKVTTEVRQNDSISPDQNTFLSSFSLSYGFLTFKGDIAGSKSLNSKVNNSGFQLQAERRINSTLGVSINALFGNILENKGPIDPGTNFKTTVFQYSLNLTLRTDNGIWLSKKAGFAPFASIGLGLLHFNPKGDLKDANGQSYYYWTDSSIRNEEQTGSNYEATSIRRDYYYETDFTSSYNDSLSYNRITPILPITLGLKMKVTNTIHASIHSTLHLTGTDFIDNLKGNDKNDIFIFTGISLIYNLDHSLYITVPVPTGEDEQGMSYEQLYADVNWNDLDQSDYDNDGVIDIIDDCPQTPDGLEVYKNGCPLDNDKDGIPDYQDKELQTPSGANVNIFGEELIDSIMYFQYLVRVDSLAEYMPFTYRKRLEITRAELTARKFYSIRLYSYERDHEPNPAVIKQIKALGGHERQIMENGATIYTYGAYVTGKEALAMRKKLIQKGFSNNISVIKYVPFIE